MITNVRRTSAIFSASIAASVAAAFAAASLSFDLSPERERSTFAYVLALEGNTESIQHISHNKCILRVVNT